MEVDRISNIPLDLTHKILECLPIKEAAKTSVLSQHWRFKWASIPQLILDQSFYESIQERGNEPAYLSLVYSKVVNNIILSRAGPISKFVLYFPSWFPAETYLWIRFVCANNGVKEFSLKFSPLLIKNVPTSLFTCSSLTHLTLMGCVFHSLPPAFNSFPHLVNLNLKLLSINVKVLEILITKCPQLESLHLDDLCINREINFTIRAPKLKNLFVTRLSLKETTSLNTVGLDIILTDDIISIFNCFANVESLVLERNTWYLGSSNSRQFPYKLGQLRTLKLVGISLYNSHINCDNLTIAFVLGLFASSPQLEQLSIQVSDNESFHYIDCPIQINQSCIIQRLRKVELLGISGYICELQLIKHILAHSPILRNMTIELHRIMVAEQKYNFALEVMQYCRASPTAKIIIKDKYGS